MSRYVPSRQWMHDPAAERGFDRREDVEAVDPELLPGELGRREPACLTTGAVLVRAGRTADGHPLPLGQAPAIADNLQGGHGCIAAAQQPGEVGHGVPQGREARRTERLGIAGVRTTMASAVGHESTSHSCDVDGVSGAGGRPCRKPAIRGILPPRRTRRHAPARANRGQGGTVGCGRSCSSFRAGLPGPQLRRDDPRALALARWRWPSGGRGARKSSPTPSTSWRPGCSWAA